MLTLEESQVGWKWSFWGLKLVHSRGKCVTAGAGVLSTILTGAGQGLFIHPPPALCWAACPAGFPQPGHLKNTDFTVMLWFKIDAEYASKPTVMNEDGTDNSKIASSYLSNRSIKNQNIVSQKGESFLFLRVFSPNMSSDWKNIIINPTLKYFTRLLTEHCIPLEDNNFKYSLSTR